MSAPTYNPLLLPKRDILFSQRSAVTGPAHGVEEKVTSEGTVEDITEFGDVTLPAFRDCECISPDAQGLWFKIGCRHGRWGEACRVKATVHRRLKCSKKSPSPKLKQHKIAMKAI
ncbi:hypothetical protein V502_03891 [Pseudogymnoascus sp. VKM F-4520 (FW-2644)]|nr:hypothetical protein V502_03891 [Pseudogymnoascus sp. VKM F-4520 (FW-2644)]